MLVVALVAGLVLMLRHKEKIISAALTTCRQGMNSSVSNVYNKIYINIVSTQLYLF
jgi:hypothetical protein